MADNSQFLKKIAKIYNSDLSKELVDGAKIQLSREAAPDQIADKVVPVMEVNPKLLRRTNWVFTNNNAVTGSATIKAIPTGMNFYITAINFQIIKDAACDVADGQATITAVIDGLTTTIASIPVFTLLAQQYNCTLNFAYPIKCDAGTNISLGSNVFNAGKMRRISQVYGYFDDKING